MQLIRKGDTGGLRTHTVRRLLIACLVLLPVASGWAQTPDPAEVMQEAFSIFANEANRILPGSFGEISPELQKKLDAVEIPWEEEDAVGQKVLDAFLTHVKRQGVEVHSQGKDVDYLRQLVQTVRPLMRQADRYREFRIYVMQSDQAEAYSMPGGRLLFSTGMLVEGESEAAVIGVVGHELSHLDRGHQLLTLRQSKLAGQPLDLQNSLSLLALFVRPFRPEQESQADHDATQWMMQLGYEPRELARLLMRWSETQQRQTPWMQFVPEFVRSHPDPQRRAREVLRIARDLSAAHPDADFVGRENLRQRMPQRR